MTLADLWAELKALPQTLGKPLHDPTWFRQHTAAHLVGGPMWWLVGCFFWFAPFSLKAWLFAVAATVIRQGFMREAKGPREFPLYAMVWDSVTSGLAAGVCAVIVAVLRG